MVGDKIKQRRQEMGMTQTELAKKVGYGSKQAICYIENGQRDVNQTTLRKFSEVLNVDINYFFDFDSDELSEQKRALLDKLSKATEEEIHTIDKMVDVILNK